MELDDLKAAWQAMDVRIVANRALNISLLREIKLTTARSALRPLEWLLWLEMAAAAAVAVLVGGFLGEHWRLARFALPALALHVTAILVLAGTAAELHAVRTIDYAAPVVRLQGALTRLARMRVRNAQWLLLAAPLLWTPFAVVLAQGLWGFDLYHHFGTGWIVTNFAVGLALVPLMYWMARRFDARAERAGIIQSLADDVAGRSLAAASRIVDEISRFEREE